MLKDESVLNVKFALLVALNVAPEFTVKLVPEVNIELATECVVVPLSMKYPPPVIAELNSNFVPVIFAFV